MYLRQFRLATLGVAASTVAACGGGGGGKANVSSFDLGQPPVFANGEPVTSSTFNGQTFPLYFIGAVIADTPGQTAELARGAGSITVSLDGDTLTIQTDDLPVELVRDGDVFVWTVPDAGDVTFVQDELGAQRTILLDDPLFEDLFELVGTYGFRTPGSLMPGGGVVTYDTNTLGRLVLSETGFEGLTIFNDFSDVSLVADFNAGTMSGVLFDGSTFADVDGDGFADDVLVVELQLNNSRISGGTFGGTVDGVAAAFIDDDIEGFVNLSPSFSNTDVDGYFFGNDAERIGGTYEGDYRTSGDNRTIRGSFVGYFDAAETFD